MLDANLTASSYLGLHQVLPLSLGIALVVSVFTQDCLIWPMIILSSTIFSRIRENFWEQSYLTIEHASLPVIRDPLFLKQKTVKKGSLIRRKILLSCSQTITLSVSSLISKKMFPETIRQ